MIMNIKESLITTEMFKLPLILKISFDHLFEFLYNWDAYWLMM